MTEAWCRQYVFGFFEATEKIGGERPRPNTRPEPVAAFAAMILVERFVPPETCHAIPTPYR